MTSKQQSKLTAAKTADFLKNLKARFENNRHRHPNLEWKFVEKQLTAEKLSSLWQMEDSGGEPDVITSINAPTKAKPKMEPMLMFCDFSKESPSGRRSLCYDREALQKRKANKPKGNALDWASANGVKLLTEEQYRALQSIEDLDLKTSSWIWTPPEIRSRGGALFCDRRYDHVFTYHNGAESYYAVRGFRVSLSL